MSHVYTLKKHFLNFISRNNTVIPQSVYDDIIIEITKRKIDLKTLSFAKTRRILQKLGLYKYSDYCVQITNTLTGKITPKLSQEDITYLTELYSKVNVAQQEIQVKNRMNILNCNYVTNKLIGQLEIEHKKKIKENDKRKRQAVSYLNLPEDIVRYVIIRYMHINEKKYPEYQSLMNLNVLQYHDCIWKEVCDKIGIKFEPSL
jgi:hypothetical protein